MNAEGWWRKWNEIRALAGEREIVLWGRSEEWVQKTLSRLHKKPILICDINPGYANTEYYGIKVVSPDVILNDTVGKYYVVVTAGPYEGIVHSLIDHNWIAGQDFCCSPEFYDFNLLEEMRCYQQSVIVVSSDYMDQENARSSQEGGGIYRYNLHENRAERLVKGQFRQIERVKQNYMAVEYVEMAIYIFDLEFKILNKIPLDRPNYCGIAFDQKRNNIVVANSTTDRLIFMNADTFDIVDDVPFSYKCDLNVRSPHHINDVCIDGDYLYCTYFSYGGAWRKGQYDGGVSELHLDRPHEPLVPLTNGLWSPHSPKIIDGNLWYLDSMRGRFYMNNQTFAVELNGFARGLASDGRFVYVGISEDMYMSRVYGTRNSIMMNAGFYLIDIETKACRFHPMFGNMNIHDLLIEAQ
mgnify:CR=1 FL=1